MIITRIDDLDVYQNVNPYFIDLIEFLHTNNIYAISEGPIKIKGEQLFGNCFKYLADGRCGEFFETHRKYLDIHVVLENCEDMAVSSINSANLTKDYDDENDIEFYEGKVEQLVHLTPGDCLITFPQDFHQPKIRVNDELVKKVVFKVALN
ncbi:YhcH/YjgK/YiaL family protein [Streptococcus merionis]|uniref:Beta-galactosidase subunit beta n=1 Tax=Streptococcus merionis TaxID=400065 RepID=A0A239SWE1_9STRE|nr:YhcH/YjgK/YiaL family protein [Streptococcus merionis]SNU89552.1 beta-galactosidase subunit beta [Streptococcus merionis]